MSINTVEVLFQELNTTGARLEGALGIHSKAIDDHAESITKWADAEHVYRTKQAQVVLSSNGSNADKRKAEVDLACGEEMVRAHVTKEMIQVARERVDNAKEIITSLRALLSAQQSQLNAIKIDMQTLGMREG